MDTRSYLNNANEVFKIIPIPPAPTYHSTVEDRIFISNA